jgi:hypothetical protein
LLPGVALSPVTRMTQDPFSAHTFDPETLRVLFGVFDAVWKRIEGRTDASNRERVRDAIAVAIVDLAKVGQLDPRLLEAYATDRAYAALALVALVSAAGNLSVGGTAGNEEADATQRNVDGATVAARTALSVSRFPPSDQNS